MRGVYYDGTVFEPWDPDFGLPKFRLMFAGFTMVGSAVVRANSDISDKRFEGKTCCFSQCLPKRGN